MGNGSAFCAITLLHLPSHTLPYSHFGSTVLQNLNTSPKKFYVKRGNLIASSSDMGRQILSYTTLQKAPFSLALNTARDVII